ncbi:alpha/beta hydrolase [Chryseobacterium vaccae]|uniref:alpha/beta hydrolase n=1 Tax=Chryseobacterium vaccae TaxID=2604424 RepID=UPI0018C8C05C|nr:alpha/beta hydrolase [Chryseobacterium vaccae]
MKRLKNRFSTKIIPSILGVCFMFSCTQSKKNKVVEKEKEKKETVIEPFKPWQEQKQIPIWTKIPYAELVQGTEIYNDGMVSNVSNPTITIYKPKNNNTGTAVIVFPGGGYNKLAIELEGSEVCEWLASIGVTGILLKYRVPASGPHYNKDCRCEKDPIKPLALQDAQRTIGLVRSQAKEWNIDPNKIGVMGFSAGGHLVAEVSTNYEKRVYPISDTTDQISCKPDFGIVFYPGHMTFHTSKPYELNPTIPVNKNTPPTFILHAGNDNIDNIKNSLVYYMALQKAGVKTEYHIYAEGGHAFGLNESAQKIPNWNKLPIADWEKLVERWLQTINVIPESK